MGVVDSKGVVIVSGRQVDYCTTRQTGADEIDGGVDFSKGKDLNWQRVKSEEAVLCESREARDIDSRPRPTTFGTSEDSPEMEWEGVDSGVLIVTRYPDQDASSPGSNEPVSEFDHCPSTCCFNYYVRSASFERVDNRSVGIIRVNKYRPSGAHVTCLIQSALDSVDADNRVAAGDSSCLDGQQSDPSGAEDYNRFTHYESRVSTNDASGCGRGAAQEREDSRVQG